MATCSLSLSRSKHIGNVSSKLHRQLGTIRTMVGAIDGERERLMALMIELERAGITEGRPHYHQGKYLYLVQPMRKGVRKKEYIGSNIHRVRNIEEKVANFNKFREHLSTLNLLEQHAEKLSHKLDRLIKLSKAINALPALPINITA